MKQIVAYGVVIGIAFALLLGTLVVLVRPLQVSDPPDITQEDAVRPYDYCSRTFNAHLGKGQFPDPASDSREDGEVFTMTRLWYSWFEDGRSYPLAVEGRLRACDQIGGFGSPPDNIYYRFLYSENGNTWTGFSQGTQESLAAGVYHDTLTLGAFEKDVPLGAFSLQLDGFEFEPCAFDDSKVKDIGRGPEGYGVQCAKTGESKQIKDGAVLQVQVLVARYGAFIGFGNFEPMIVFQDEVELRSALPEVGWSQPGYETGQSALVEWTVPTTAYETCDANGNCQTRPAYFLEVRDMNTNGALPAFDRIPITARSGNAAISVSATFFSNDLATCQNRLRALLYSELIIVDQAGASVRQAETTLNITAPVVTGITADKDEYSEGDLVSLSWTATGNVTKYHITAHIGGLLLLDRDTVATNASAVASATGILEVEVTAINRCQPSDVRKEQWTVGAVFTGLCQQFPDAEGCRDEGDLIALVVAALLIIGLFLLLAVLLWVFTRLDLPVAFQLGIPLLLTGIAALALLLTGQFAALGGG